MIALLIKAKLVSDSCSVCLKWHITGTCIYMDLLKLCNIFFLQIILKKYSLFLSILMIGQKKFANSL